MRIGVPLRELEKQSFDDLRLQGLQTAILQLRTDLATHTHQVIGLSGGNTADHIVNASLNIFSRKILKDFEFGPDDYAGAFKTGDIAWNASTGVVSGGTGILINKNGIVGALDGSVTFSITTAGSATFAGILSAASGTLGAITVGADAWHVDSSGNMWWGSSATYGGATNKVSAVGLYQGVFQGAFRTNATDPSIQITGTSVNAYFLMRNTTTANQLKIEYSSGVPIISTVSNVGSSVTFLTLTHTGSSSANLINLASATSANIQNLTKSGSGAWIEMISDTINSDDICVGLKMSIGNAGTGLEYAFSFQGSETVSAAVGGSQDKKIRIKIGATNYYIPCHTA